MRSVLETTALVGDLESYFQLLGVKHIKKLVYLMVSAETAPDVNHYTLNEIPGLWRVSSALVDIPINRYSTDTFELMNQAVTQWRVELRHRPPTASSVFAPDADIYFINVSLMELEDIEEHVRLMNIPTNLALTDDQLDHLLSAAPSCSELTRNFSGSCATSKRQPLRCCGKHRIERQGRASGLFSHPAGEELHPSLAE